MKCDKCYKCFRYYERNNIYDNNIQMFLVELIVEIK